MTVWVFLKTFIVTQDSFQVEELLRWRSQLELTNKEVRLQVLNNYPSKQVNFSINLVGYALEVIPKTLATNCGMDVVRIITELRAKHAEKGNSTFGIDGNTRKIADMSIQNIW